MKYLITISIILIFLSLGCKKESAIESFAGEYEMDCECSCKQYSSKNCKIEITKYSSDMIKLNISGVNNLPEESVKQREKLMELQNKLSKMVLL